MANKNHPIFIFLSSVCFYVSLFKILWFGIGLADGEDILFEDWSLFVNLIAYFCESEFSNFEIDQVDYGAWGFRMEDSTSEQYRIVTMLAR